MDNKELSLFSKKHTVSEFMGLGDSPRENVYSGRDAGQMEVYGGQPKKETEIKIRRKLENYKIIMSQTPR